MPTSISEIDNKIQDLGNKYQDKVLENLVSEGFIDVTTSNAVKSALQLNERDLQALPNKYVQDLVHGVKDAVQNFKNDCIDDARTAMVLSGAERALADLNRYNNDSRREFLFQSYFRDMPLLSAIESQKQNPNRSLSRYLPNKRVAAISLQPRANNLGAATRTTAELMSGLGTAPSDRGRGAKTTRARGQNKGSKKSFASFLGKRRG